MTDRPVGGTPPEDVPDQGEPPRQPQGPGETGPAPRWGQYAAGGQPPVPPSTLPESGPGPQPPGGQQGAGQPPAGQPVSGAGGWQYSQYGQYGQPGQYGPYGTPAPGFRPVPAAPRPGIIPLRPLSLGELLDGAFRAIRTNPKVMFGLSAAVVTFTALVQLAITWTFFRNLESLVIQSTSTRTSDLEAIDALLGDLASQLAVAGGAQTISAIVTTILSGLLIISVSQSVLGRKASLAEVWSSAQGRILRLLGLSLLVVIIVAAPLVPWAAALAIAIATDQVGIAVAVGLLGGIAVLIAMAFLVTKTVLATPALMLERSGILTALRRGWSLTSGTFWRVLGTYLLTTLLVAVVSGAISGSVSVIWQFTAADPATVLFSTPYLIASTIAQIAAAALTTPFTAAVVALLYIDVRMRTEGLDLELARSAEQAS